MKNAAFCFDPHRRIRRDAASRVPYLLASGQTVEIPAEVAAMLEELAQLKAAAARPQESADAIDRKVANYLQRQGFDLSGPSIPAPHRQRTPKTRADSRGRPINPKPRDGRYDATVAEYLRKQGF